MKKMFKCFLSLACIVCLSSLSVTAQAAHKKAHKPVARSAATTQTSKIKRTRAKSVVTVDKTCKTVRVKTAKGYRNQRKCASTSAAAGALHSPIGAGELNAAAGSARQPELKARTIPDRAYAVDGYTFFHQGRKYRVVGINEEVVPAGSDLAKQRLQLALDSGAISVEPEAVDDSGTMRALVRVGGKNLADVLNTR
ncbi:MAG: hypothetical protein JWL63_2969 [Rhodocyclales bacterium]|nr:hypothetical protein [Rhodocyclales bacterium]